MYVWRKLQRLGALLIHDAVWVLPATPRTIENFQWLAMEIAEIKGDAMVWQGQLTLAGQEEALMARFDNQVGEIYNHILNELETADADLAALGRRFNRLLGRITFARRSGVRVRAELLRREGRAAL